MISVSEVRTYDEGIAWDRYVLSHAMASGYQLMGWRRVVEKAFGHRTFYLMVRDEHGQVRGVLPLVFISSRLFGRFLVSMPFVNYGGVLTDSVDAQRALLEAAVSRAICASRRMETASPAASSAGLTILEPELRRASDLLNIASLLCRLLAAAMACVLVLMTIRLFSLGV